MAQGTKWYNNGEKNIQIKEGDLIPEGFVPGMKPHPYSEERRKEINKKRQKTCLEKFGVECIFQSEEKKKKIRETSLKRYGTENPMQSEEVKAHLREVIREKYGTEYFWQSDSAKEKIRRTNLERYGVDHPAKTKEFQEKIKQTCIDLYGGYTLQSDVLKERVRQTNIKRYGVENPFQSEECKEKAKQTSLERYGTEYPMQSDEVKSRIKKTCMRKYGVEWNCLSPKSLLSAGSCNSHSNIEFCNILDSFGINYTREYTLIRYSYDFKVGNRLIEIDPFSTHNSEWGMRGGEGKKFDYHQKKSHIAEDRGYQVIHIFDWDDKNKIVKSILLPRDRVFARRCNIREVSQKEADEFLNEYHLQNTCDNQNIRIGLYFNDELISIMTFRNIGIEDGYKYELLRYCSSKSVIGGANKLFTYFIREYQPKSIISYCDRSKFRGDLYNKLGFTILSKGVPRCNWYNKKSKEILTTIPNVMKDNTSLVPIFDCGQDTYIWSV